jgi:outer membrane protein
MTMKRKIIQVFLILAAGFLTGLPSGSASAQDAPADSLTIEQALRLVRENNPKVRQAAEGVNIADAKVTQSRSGFFPQITASAGYRYRDPVSEMSFGGQPPIKFMPNDNYDARVTAEMMLLDFGRTSRTVDLALSGRKSAEHELELTGRDLSYAAARLFYTLLFVRQAVQVQDKEIAALKKSLDYTRKRYGEGASTKFDVLTTEVRLASASNKKIDLENDLKNGEISFRRLTGLTDTAPLRLKGSFAAVPSTADAARLTAEALEQRAELKLAKEQELSAKYRKSLAGKEGMPKIIGSVSYGAANGYQPDIDEIRENFSGGVELQLPIFTGFRTSAGKREAVAMMRAAEQQRIDTEQEIREEVERSINSLRTSSVKIGTTDLQVKQAKLAAEHARIRYENGLATTLDLLDTEAALSEAELGHLQALYEYTLNTYTLKRAAGEQFWQ